MKCLNIAAMLLLLVVSVAFAAPNTQAKLFKYNSTVEKERPELDANTQALIAAYRRNPSDANRAALKRQIEQNYEHILARKKAKLAELEKTAKTADKVEEMRGIVSEMIQDRDGRVEQTLRRFTDPRLYPGVRETKDGYLPILGAASTVSIAYIPVTNEDYARFLKASGHKAPKHWKNGDIPANKARHPVVGVSYADALAYCDWLSVNDAKARYRLPTEAEWALAAGHMPKDADFNCGENDGTTPVDIYAKTLAACGAVDMWGNCWEWTATEISQNGERRAMIVKGGAWNSPRMQCRTEYKGEGRAAASGYDDVAFRVVRER